VVAAPTENQPTQAVTLSQASAMLGIGNTGGSNTTASNTNPAGTSTTVNVSVPVSQNSIAQIVNGGVKLPDGVEQELFVVSPK